MQILSYIFNRVFGWRFGSLRQFQIVRVALSDSAVVHVLSSSFLSHFHFDEIKEVSLVLLYSSVFLSRIISQWHIPFLYLWIFWRTFFLLIHEYSRAFFDSLADDVLSGLPHEVVEASPLKLLKLDFFHNLISHIIMLVIDHYGPVFSRVESLINLLPKPLQLRLFQHPQLFSLVLGQLLNNSALLHQFLNVNMHFFVQVRIGFREQTSFFLFVQEFRLLLLKIICES